MKILIGGDFVPQKRVAKYFSKGDYESILGQLKPLTEEVDMTIVNLEAPIVESQQCAPIDKVGPHLKTNVGVIGALKYAGIDTVTLANNHIHDYGDWGVNDTIFNLSRNDMSFVGAGLDLNDSKAILYKQAGERIIAIVNCCEHEFSIAGKAKAGANPLNPVAQYYAIMEARTKADFVIVIVHGGIEHYQYPTPRMQETYRFFIDAGADSVINHHQHCFSGYEYYNGKPIVYGTGNLCFDNGNTSHGSWNEGYLVQLEFKKDFDTKMKLIPYHQANSNPAIELLDEGPETEKFVAAIIALNDMIADPVELKEHHQDFMKRTRRSYLTTVSPYSDKLNSLYARHLLPGIMTKKKWLTLLNRIQCESHVERLTDMIKSEIE